MELFGSLHQPQLVWVPPWIPFSRRAQASDQWNLYSARSLEPKVGRYCWLPPERLSGGTQLQTSLIGSARFEVVHVAVQVSRKTYNPLQRGAYDSDRFRACRESGGGFLLHNSQS